MFALKREWDSDDYLEETTWGLYAWAAKGLKNPFMQVKWETNNMQGHAMHVKAGECNAIMHRKVHMQGHAMQCIAKVYKL